MKFLVVGVLALSFMFGIFSQAEILNSQELLSRTYVQPGDKVVVGANQIHFLKEVYAQQNFIAGSGQLIFNSVRDGVDRDIAEVTINNHGTVRKIVVDGVSIKMIGYDMLSFETIQSSGNTHLWKAQNGLEQLCGGEQALWVEHMSFSLSGYQIGCHTVEKIMAQNWNAEFNFNAEMAVVNTKVGFWTQNGYPGSAEAVINHENGTRIIGRPVFETRYSGSTIEDSFLNTHEISSARSYFNNEIESLVLSTVKEAVIYIRESEYDFSTPLIDYSLPYYSRGPEYDYAFVFYANGNLKRAILHGKEAEFHTSESSTITIDATLMRVQLDFNRDGFLESYKSL